MNDNYKINYSSVLNKQQLKAVTTIDGPNLIIAGAGTGKTNTLVYRVAYLVEKGIKPESILLLTFTRKAAKEMMQRASNILDDRCNKIAGGTFHSFANSILRQYAKLIDYSNNFTIIDQSDSVSLIRHLISRLGFNKGKKRFPKNKTVQSVISKSINTKYSIKEILEMDYPNHINENKRIKRIAEKYSKQKQIRNLMDYNDLLVNMVKLLDENSEIRTRISSTYKFIMIDEFQDTNHIQALYASLIASEHENIMVVGDDSQSIYSFRGANFRNIMDFPKIFAQTKIHKLEQNYRSSQPILNLANKLIENANEKYNKKLFSKIPGKNKPVFIVPDNKNDEANFVCKKILELRDYGIDLNRICVLFRSSYHSYNLESKLHDRDIPFKKYGGRKFIEAAHIKDVISILRIAYNPHDTLAWLRVLRLFEGIGAKTADKIIDIILNKNLGLKGIISPSFKSKKYYSDLKRLHDFLTGILKENKKSLASLSDIINFYEPILEYKYDYIKKRKFDLKSLLELSENYSSTEKFLTNMSLEPPESSQVKSGPSDENNEKLILSTIHSAKGLEWHTVFIIQLVDGDFPSSYTLKNNEQIEEERRLLYVACTRAQKNLFLLSPNYSFNSFDDERTAFGEPSRFIMEIESFEELADRKKLSSDEQNSINIDDKENKNKNNSNDTYKRIKNYFENQVK